MTVNLNLDGKNLKVEVAKPTFELKERVRKITVQYIESLDKLDKNIKIPDDPKLQNPLEVIRKSNESEQISDVFTIKYFIAIASKIPDEVRNEFVVFNDEPSDFWQKQDLSQLQQAVSFFRNGK